MHRSHRIACINRSHRSAITLQKNLGDASLGQVSIFMSALGVQNFLVNCIPTAVLYIFKVEMIVWTQVPWQILAGSALFALLFNFLINFGIALTHPLFISVGLFLGMPLSAGFVLLFRNIIMSKFMIIGSVLILASFLVLLIPANWRSSQTLTTTTNEE